VTHETESEVPEAHAGVKVLVPSTPPAPPPPPAAPPAPAPAPPSPPLDKGPAVLHFTQVTQCVVTAEAAAVAGLSTRQGALALEPLH
jgi:hypothetical protein